MQKPLTNVVELKQIQDNLRLTVEIMLTLLMDLKTKSPENFEHLSVQLTERTDMNAYDLVDLIAEMWDIYQ